MVAKLSSADTFVQEGIEVLHLESLKNFTLCNPSEQRETLYYIYFALVVGIFIGISTVLCFVEYLGRKILMCEYMVHCKLFINPLYTSNYIFHKKLSSTSILRKNKI